MAVLLTRAGNGAALTSAQIDANLAALNAVVSITEKGLVPTAPNDITKFLAGDGTWRVLPITLATIHANALSF